jgi:hypothetical protein
MAYRSDRLDFALSILALLRTAAVAAGKLAEMEEAMAAADLRASKFSSRQETPS